MKHEIKLPIALLKAAHLCASDDDFIRPMLENIANASEIESLICDAKFKEARWRK
ncbi:hypothetical protein [Acinetobacter sp. V89_7]|uniref:hypothetical protein n=1 Tax=Acinetobacter sp. V89_7 TaxID=3044233 RepID=UPI00249EF30F|nr:hypothetical protein [Acinetobacter sp. V89_7]MDI3379265.1 hypothetical protein [Acinetobacter sp. V89_7]